MQQFDTAIQATNTALHSQGSGYRENEEYLKSLEARINMLKNAWTELTLAFGDSFLTDTFISITHLLTNLAKFAKFATDNVGALPFILANIGSMSILLSKRFREAAVTGTIFSASLQGVGISANFARNAFRALMASTGVGLVFAGVGLVLEKLIGYIGDSIAEAENLDEALHDNYQSYANNAEKINELHDAYQRLSSKTALTAEEHRELHQIRENLSRYIPTIIKGYDDEGNAIYASRDEVSKLVEEYEELNLERAKFIANSLSERVASDIKEIEKLRKEVRKLNNDYKRLNAEFEATNFVRRFVDENDLAELDKHSEEYREKIDELRRSVQEIFDKSDAGINLDAFLASTMMDLGRGDTIKTLEELRSNIATTEKSISDKTREIDQHLRTLSTGLKARNDIVASEFGQMNQQTKRLVDNLAEGFIESNKITSDNIDEIIFHYEEFVTELFRLNEEGKFNFEELDEENLVKIRNEINRLSSDFTGITLPVSKVDELIDSLKNNFSGLGLESDDLRDSIDDVNASMSDQEEEGNKLTTVYREMVDEVKFLNDVQKELDDTNTISLDTIDKLVEKYSDIIDVTDLSIDKIKEYILEKRNEANSSMQAEKEKTEQQIQATELRIETMNREIDAIHRLRQARGEDFVRSVLGQRTRFMMDINDPRSFRQFNQTWDHLESLAEVPASFIQLFNAEILSNMPDYKQQEWMNQFGDIYSGSFDAIISSLSSGIEKAEVELGDLKVKTSLLQIALDEAVSSSTSSSSRSAESKLTELNLSKELANSYRAEYEARKQIIDSIQRKIDLTDSDDTERLLDLQNKKLIEQEAAVEALREANNRLHQSANVLRESNPRIDEWFDSVAEPTEAYIRHLESIRNNNSLSIEQRNQMIEQTQALFAEMQLLMKSHMSNTSEIINMTNAINSTNEAIERATNEHRQRQFAQSEEWIQRETKRMEMAGASELEIAQMIYDARVRMADESWTEIRNIAALSAKEQEEADYKAYQALQRINDLIDRDREERRNNLERVADQAIGVLKEYYREQQRYAQEAIDKELRGLEKAHREKMHMLDEELSRYEDMVNEKLKSMDLAEEERSFDKQLTEAQREAQEIRNQISIKSLNDSLEARYELERLEEELANKIEEIEEIKHKRSLDLRRQNLKDSLESKRKEMENEKENSRFTVNLYDRETRKLIETRQLTYEHARELLEKEKEDHTQYWEDKITNERNFNRLREEILEENLTEMETLLSGFADNVDKTLSGLSRNLQDNLIDKINEARNALKDAISTSSSAGSSATGANSSPNIDLRESAHREYVANKKEWMDIQSRFMGAKDHPRQKELNERNEELRQQYGFKDYTREDLLLNRIEQFRSGGYTGNFKGGKLGILHEKELVLNKSDTPNLLKVISFTRDIVNNIAGRTRSEKPSSRITNNTKNEKTIIEKIEINLGDNYSKKDGKRFADDVIKKLESRGVRV